MRYYGVQCCTGEFVYSEEEGGVAMNPKRIWSILCKDLRLGPRNPPFFLFAVIMPVALTFIFQVTFGSLSIRNPAWA